MSRTITSALALTLILGTGASARQGAATAPAQNAKPAPEAESKPRVPEPLGQPVNIKIDLTITDQGGPGEPAKRVISMIVADRQAGFIRTRGTVRHVDAQNRPVTLNVDARPIITREGAVRVELGLEYQATPPGVTTAPAPPGPSPDPYGTNLNERVGVILETGKPLIVSQAVDPASDRKIAVELRATILK